MIDHIVNFPDEEAARADPVVGQYWVGEDADAAWRGDIMIPGISVYRVTGTEIITPPAGAPPFEQEIREPYPGWFAVIALPQLSEELRDLPAEACMIIADRDASERSDPGFVLYLAPSFNQDDLPITEAQPQFAGSHYPFRLAVLRARPVKED